MLKLRDIKEKSKYQSKTLYPLLWKEFVCFWLYTGELCHIRWKHVLILLCYCLYLEIKYGLKRCVRVPTWNRVDLWLSLLCVRLGGPQDTQIFCQTLFWVFWWWCFWMRLKFNLIEFEKSRFPSRRWAGCIQSAEDLNRIKRSLPMPSTSTPQQEEIMQQTAFSFICNTGSS